MGPAAAAETAKAALGRDAGSAALANDAHACAALTGVQLAVDAAAVAACGLAVIEADMGQRHRGGSTHEQPAAQARATAAAAVIAIGSIAALGQDMGDRQPLDQHIAGQHLKPAMGVLAVQRSVLAVQGQLDAGGKLHGPAGQR